MPSRVRPGRDRPLRVLLVEDNPSDVFFVEETLGQLNLDLDLQVARDGEEAVEMLQARAEAGDLPDLVLLDINLPKLNGHEVLQQVRASQALRTVPVTVYTSSDAPEDVQAAYAHGANAYHRKPANLHGIANLFRTYMDYWVGHAILPA